MVPSSRQHLATSRPQLAHISRVSPQVRIEVYKPDEISEEELARSNTIQARAWVRARARVRANPNPNPNPNPSALQRSVSCSP